MKIPISIPTFRTLRDAAVSISSLATTIAKSWDVEHRSDGRHAFPWVSVPFSADLFGAGWTVDPVDVRALEYRTIGDAIELHWRIGSTVVSAAAGAELRLAIPGGLRAVSDSCSTHAYADNGVLGVGQACALSGDAFVRLLKFDGAAWAVSPSTATYGTITIRTR